MAPRAILAAALAIAGSSALAQAPLTGQAAPAAGGAAAALPPQNYGAQPGFFRGAPEMAALESANHGVIPTPPTPVAPPVPAPIPSAPTVQAAPPVAAASAAVPAERVPDPTQNLQWAERQMDRAEATAAQQRQQPQAPPIAPGAYNGATDPNDR